ncbi:MAG: ABC transporter permease [Sphingomonadaceae bacterium]|nr:ABC transporter permease [Sphingomonadaceae bacterium]
MSALILSVLSWAWPYIAGAFGLVALVVQQRMAGAKAERAKQAEREREARDIADRVDNDIGAMPPANQREELSKWSRR